MTAIPVFTTPDDASLHIGMFGDIGGANASPAIQGMVNAVGYFTLPVGTFLCKDPIDVQPPNLSIDTVFSGRGLGKSVLQATNMAGASLIKPCASTGLYRFSMRDLTLIGDADSAFDFTLDDGGGNQLYKSQFQNVHFRSIAGPAFKSRNEFATTHINCSFHSDQGHALHMGGGNSTLLISCYAHKCGNGMAGYRIEKQATLIACLGLDDATSPCYWGWFGKEWDGIYRVAIIGGNAEDFRTAAIALEYSGRISVENVQLLAPASGLFETYVKIISGSEHQITLLPGVSPGTKGAARSGQSNIQGTGCAPLVFNHTSDGGPWADYYNTTQSLLYSVPNLHVRNTAYGRMSLQVTNLHSGRESGFIKPDVKTITVNATTFAAAGLNSVKTANTQLTFLAQLTGGEEGQELALLIGDANTTIKHNTGGAGRFVLKSGADETPANGAVYKFVSFGSVWRQV